MTWNPEADRARRSEARHRIVGVIATLCTFTVLALRCALHYEADEVRRRDFEIQLPMSRDLSTTPALSALDPPSSTMADLDATLRGLCKRLLACGGRTPQEVTAQLDDCVRSQSRLATDTFSRDVIAMSGKAVLSECGQLGCDKFADCYMDTLKRVAGGTSQPAKPVSPELKRRFIALMCDVALENAGKVPDFNAPSASPKMTELQNVVAEIGSVDALAGLAKEAMASCPDGTVAPLPTRIPR